MIKSVDITFNLNDKVQVKLTNWGIEVYAKYFVAENANDTIYHAQLSKRKMYIKADQEKWGHTTMQFHEFMAAFGSASYNGADQIIVDNEMRIKHYKAVLIFDSSNI